MKAIRNALKVESDEVGMRAYHEVEAGRQFSCRSPRNEAEITRATSYLSSDPSNLAVTSTEAPQVSTHPPDGESKSAAGVIRPDAANGANRNGTRSGSHAKQMGLAPIMKPEIARYGSINGGSSSSCSRSNGISMQGPERGTSGEEETRMMETKLREQEELRDQLQKLVSQKLSQGGLDHAGIIALGTLAKLPSPPPVMSPRSRCSQRGTSGEEKTRMMETKLRDQEKFRDQLQKLVSQQLSQGELDHKGTTALETLSKMPPPPPVMSPRSRGSLPEKNDNCRTHSGGSRKKQRLPPGVENLPKFSGKEPSALTDILNRFHALVVHGLPGSTADQVNHALLRDLVFVLEGRALKYYNDLQNGRVRWEPIPPGEGQKAGAGGSPSIRPPSTWVETCEAMHDHFLPAQGIARTAKALLNLRQALGESVSSLATRQVGLCHHLNRLVDANGGQPTYWDAISMALFEQALRGDLRRAHEAEPPCSSFQDSVNRAEHNADVAAAARHASDKQRGSAAPGETPAFSMTPASPALGPGSPEARIPSTVSVTATTPVAVTTTFTRGSSGSSLEGNEDQHNKTLTPAETLPCPPTPSSNNDAGGPPAAPTGNGVEDGVNEAGCNNPRLRRTSSNTENISDGNKKQISVCSGNELVTVKCEAAIDVSCKRKHNNDHIDNPPKAAELPRKSHRSGSIKRGIKGTTAEKRRRTPSPRHPVAKEARLTVSAHSDHVNYNNSSRSGLLVDRHTFAPRSPSDVQAPGGSSCEAQSRFESFGGQGRGNWTGGGSFPDHNDQPIGGGKKNVTWSKDTLYLQQNRDGTHVLQEDWASRGHPSHHESTVDDRPPCRFPRCRAINRNSHSTKDCRFRTGDWPLKRQDYQNERGWRNPRSYRKDAMVSKPVVNTVEPAVDGVHKAWEGVNDGSSGGERF